MTCDTLEIPRESIERLRSEVTLAADPTATNIEFAFLDVAATRPIAPGDWTAGSYGTITGSTDTWTATIITPQLGTGGLDLAPGWWQAFARFHLGGDDPVRELGTFLIT